MNHRRLIGLLLLILLGGVLLGLDRIASLDLPRIVDRFRTQETGTDCGAASLQVILRAFEREVSLEELRRKTGTTERGTSLLALKEAAESYGLEVEGWRYRPADLPSIRLPALVYLDGGHFAVLREVRRRAVRLLDPAQGEVEYELDAFARQWPGYTLVFHRPGPSAGASSNGSRDPSQLTTGESRDSPHERGSR